MSAIVLLDAVVGAFTLVPRRMHEAQAELEPKSDTKPDSVHAQLGPARSGKREAVAWRQHEGLPYPALARWSAMMECDGSCSECQPTVGVRGWCMAKSEPTRGRGTSSVGLRPSGDQSGLGRQGWHRIMTWLKGLLVGFGIFAYFSITTVWLPSMLILGPLRTSGRNVQDLVTLAIWGFFLILGMWALRTAQRRDMI